MEKVKRGAWALMSLALVAAVGSCSGSASSGDVQADTLLLTESEVAVPYDVLRMPYALTTDGQRLVVANSPQASTLIDVYSLTGDSVTSGLRVGQGPGERQMVEGLCYDATASAVQIRTGAADAVDMLRGIDGSGLEIDRKIVFDAAACGFDTVAPASFALRMADGHVVLGNATSDGLLAILRPDGSLERYAAQYPDISGFGDMPQWGVFNFLRPNGGISPDGRHFAALFGSNDMICFGSLDGDTVAVKVNYGEKPGGIKWVTLDGYGTFDIAPERKVHFAGNPVLTDGHVYVIYSGMNYADHSAYFWKKNDGDEPLSTDIRVYDFDGNLTRVYRLPMKIGGFTVTPDDSDMYAIVDSETEGYRIFRFALPD